MVDNGSIIDFIVFQHSISNHKPKTTRPLFIDFPNDSPYLRISMYILPDHYPEVCPSNARSFLKNFIYPNSACY